MASDYSTEELESLREARERRMLAAAGDDPPPLDYDPAEDYLEEQQQVARGQTIRMASFAIVGLTIAGMVGLLGYTYLGGATGSPGSLPTIAAAAEPERVRPDERGGLQVPNQDIKVLNEAMEGGEAEAEQLLPPPEEPKRPQVAAAELAPKPTAPVESETGSAAAEPATEAEAPPAPPVPENKPDAVTKALESAAQLAEDPPKPETGAAADEASAAPANNPAKTQLALKPGDPVIQLASLKSREGAEASWRKIQSSHPTILADMPLLIQQIDIEGKGIYYRVQTGPFPNTTTAEDMCAQLKSRGQACIVTRR